MGEVGEVRVWEMKECREEGVLRSWIWSIVEGFVGYRYAFIGRKGGILLFASIMKSTDWIACN